jgi:hypothetical protein
VIPKLALAAAVILLGTSAGFAFYVLDGQDGKSPVTAVDPTATPSPTKPPATAIPGTNSLAIQWTEIAPADTAVADHGTMFLLDTRTGKLFSPIALPTGDDRRAYMSWRSDGGLSVWISAQSTYELFVGDALGDMTPVKGEARVSSRGISALLEGRQIVFTEVASGRELFRLDSKPGRYLGAWSADGKYLSLLDDGDSQTAKDPSVAILDVDTRQVVLELTADQPYWANQHDRFLYAVMDYTRGDDPVVESRIHDMTTGQDYAIGAKDAHLWSPDDRYVVGNANAGDRYDVFSIFDAQSGKELVTTRGSWPMAWIDNDTLSLMGDVCTDATSLFYVEGDGTNLRRVLDTAGFALPHAAPGGERIAYTHYGDSLPQSNSVRVFDVGSGRTQEFEVGTLYLPLYYWSSEQAWSPDGQYLMLVAPVGKDGPCMGPQPEPFQLIRRP